MNEAAELLMRNLAAAAKAGRPVDIHRLLGDMTMQVVGTTAFGCACRLPCTIRCEEMADNMHRCLGDMTMQVVGTTAFGCARRLPCSIAFEEIGRWSLSLNKNSLAQPAHGPSVL